MRTAVLLYRKHGEKNFTAHPQSGQPGSIRVLWDEVKKLLGMKRVHPEYAEVQYHESQPFVRAFKTPEQAKAEADRDAKARAAFEAAKKAKGQKPEAGKA